MASNEYAHATGVGVFPDWVELYNPGAEPVDLLDLSITDDLETPDKHVFTESLEIPPQGFLLLIASAPEGDLSPETLPFKLSSGGEELGLFHSSGLPLDQLSFGVQETDISAARSTDGGGEWVYVPNGTPGESNERP